jgi:hypothetical protein
MKAMPTGRAWSAFVLLAALASGAGAEEERQKATSDDRVDPNARLAKVGEGTHLAKQPLKPGAYFNDQARAAVRAWYAAHPLKGKVPANEWKIGGTLPAGSGPVPQGLAGKLPKLPPGLQYVQLHGDVLLVAPGSGMVVDAIDAQGK